MRARTREEGDGLHPIGFNPSDRREIACRFPVLEKPSEER
jgi:hypothetical protein